MWATIGWTLLWIVIVVVAILAIVVIMTVTAFLWDRFIVASDPSSTVIASSVSVYQAVRVANEPWGYGLVRQDRYSPKNGRQTLAVEHFREHRKAYLVDPGVLARCNQFEPMFPVIERDYDIFTLEYGGLRYDRNRSAKWVAEFVTTLLDEYDEVVYNGISHGGQHAFWVGTWLGSRAKDLSRVILHDAPYGQKTLIPLNILPGFVGSLLMFTPGTAVNFVLAPVLKLLLQLPNRKNVTLPSRENLLMLTGRAEMSFDEYFEWVKQSAKSNLSGHKVSMFYSETGDMVRAGRERFPFAVFSGVPVVYIRYIEKNATVVQPAASNVYQREVPNLQLLDTVGTHAGFTENYDGNVETLHQALPVNDSK